MFCSPMEYRLTLPLKSKVELKASWPACSRLVVDQLPGTCFSPVAALQMVMTPRQMTSWLAVRWEIHEPSDDQLSEDQPSDDQPSDERSTSRQTTSCQMTGDKSASDKLKRGDCRSWWWFDKWRAQGEKGWYLKSGLSPPPMVAAVVEGLGMNGQWILCEAFRMFSPIHDKIV